MSNTKIFRVTEDEQFINMRLLTTFEFIFSANDFHNLQGILHDNGRYFGKMNKEKACGYFYHLFFKKGGTSEKFQLHTLRGITLDHTPGETVLELRCSNQNPFIDDRAVEKRNFGEAPDTSIDEKVYRFAFSFKDEKIYSIRIPGKCTADIKKLTLNN